eukprot:1100536-Pelagomonas_calceolata.AAC.1
MQLLIVAQALAGLFCTRVGPRTSPCSSINTVWCCLKVGCGWRSCSLHGTLCNRFFIAHASTLPDVVEQWCGDVEMQMACIYACIHIYAHSPLLAVTPTLSGAAEQWRCGDAAGLRGGATGGAAEVLGGCKACGAGAA